jgi:hypothetical protein
LRMPNLEVAPQIILFFLFTLAHTQTVNKDSQESVQREGYGVNCGWGFRGRNCEEVITCEDLNFCNGHGICARGGICLCDFGWQGEECNHAYCPSNCSGHGSCSSSGEGCICDAGFSGLICNEVQCIGNCTGRGACLPGGICVCQKGFLGAGCEIVDVVAKCSNHGALLSQSLTIPFDAQFLTATAPRMQTPTPHYHANFLELCIVRHLFRRGVVVVAVVDS